MDGKYSGCCLPEPFFTGKMIGGECVTGSDITSSVSRKGQNKSPKCIKLPGPDTIHPRALKEFKWEIHTVTDHLEETTARNRVSKHKNKYVILLKN